MVRAAHLHMLWSQLCFTKIFQRNPPRREHTANESDVLIWVWVWSWPGQRPGVKHTSCHDMNMTKWCYALLCYRPKQDLWHSQTTHTAPTAAGIMKEQWIQLPDFPHYPKMPILSPKYTLFLSQLAKFEWCPVSIHEVLRDCSKFHHHIPIAIRVCNKEHKIKMHNFHLILRLFPEYLGAEISHHSATASWCLWIK